MIVLVDPKVGQIGHLDHERQIVSTKACRVSPVVAVLVQPAERHIVTRPVLGLVLPDGCTDPAKADLANKKGWYIDFDSNGEKGLAAPVILDGQLFFTTYVPEDVINAATCSIIEGIGRLWGLNVLTGAAAQNWDGVGDDTNLTKSDRTMTLGSGIPSQAVPIFQAEGVTLLIGGGGGATAVDPELDPPREISYWLEEEGT